MTTSNGFLENARLLKTLPDDLYNDGTNDWQKDGDGWTRLHPQFGVERLPQFSALRRVARRYVSLDDTSDVTENTVARGERIVEKAAELAAKHPELTLAEATEAHIRVTDIWWQLQSALEQLESAWAAGERAGEYNATCDFGLPIDNPYTSAVTTENISD